MRKIDRAPARNTKASPPGWGDDQLSQFLEIAHQNRFATFHNKKFEFQRLLDIDDCFSLVGKSWNNPASLVTPMLYFRSHAAFRSACEHSMAGQIVDAFVSIRSVIETAGYAAHLNQNPDLEEIWLRRNDNEDCKNLTRKNFEISRIKKSIKSNNISILKVFELLYERSIDFGAHTNEGAITGSMHVREIGADKDYQFSMLHSDGLPLDHALRSVAQAGVCGLEIFGGVFSGRYNQLGLFGRLPALKRGL